MARAVYAVVPLRLRGDLSCAKDPVVVHYTRPGASATATQRGSVSVAPATHDRRTTVIVAAPDPIRPRILASAAAQP